jgi:hypothetical protein
MAFLKQPGKGWKDAREVVDEAQVPTPAKIDPEPETASVSAVDHLHIPSAGVITVPLVLTWFVLVRLLDRILLLGVFGSDRRGQFPTVFRSL